MGIRPHLSAVLRYIPTIEVPPRAGRAVAADSLVHGHLSDGPFQRDTVAAMELLLLSNSTNAGAGFLEHARSEIRDIASGRAIRFIPYALADWDEYTAQAQAALPDLEIVGAHEGPHSDELTLEADCVFVGGGNTFRLLDTMRRLNLLDPLADRVRTGACRYIGSSAGTNLACPSIRTTNDMPIVDVAGSLAALNLVPFQINAHFTDELPAGLMAERRSDRIAQFHEMNDVAVLALREGAWVRVSGGQRIVGGDNSALMFTRAAVHDLEPGDSLEPWWRPGRFDDRRLALHNRHHRANAAPGSI
jgi:dipeptidase E